ncbi:MAG TPA: carboxymuconolactone decarboxylase family protein [Stellaceae bacterium]|nr:carboxymuconolactone decarboxylase family protein [Stellaceae bacterium]
MARVPYIDSKDLPPGYEDVVPSSALNIRRALANSPEGARRNGALAMFIRHKMKLDPRLRELAILQVGYLTRCVYEYAHHIELARQFGCSDDDIRAVAAETAGRPSKLEPLAKAVLRAAREMTDGLGVSDATYAVLKESLDHERYVELVLAIAVYNATVRILESLKVDLEPECRRYLEEFPLPAG